MGGEGLCLLSFLPPILLHRGEMGEEGLGMRLRKTGDWASEHTQQTKNRVRVSH